MPSVRSCHVACFSLGHVGILDCWSRSGGTPHDLSWKGSSALTSTVSRPFACHLVCLACGSGFSPHSATADFFLKGSETSDFILVVFHGITCGLRCARIPLLCRPGLCGSQLLGWLFSNRRRNLKPDTIGIVLLPESFSTARRVNVKKISHFMYAFADEKDPSINAIGCHMMSRTLPRMDWSGDDTQTGCLQEV